MVLAHPLSLSGCPADEVRFGPRPFHLAWITLPPPSTSPSDPLGWIPRSTGLRLWEARPPVPPPRGSQAQRPKRGREAPEVMAKCALGIGSKNEGVGECSRRGRREAEA